MIRYTLLEIVQSALGAAKGSNVNDIGDTTEAERVARFAKDEYYRMVADFDWKNLNTTIQLDGVTDSDYPNYLKVPEHVVKVNTFKYEKSEVTDATRRFQEVTYLHPQDFLDHIQGRDTSADNIITVTDFGGALLFIRNDIVPTYWTSFDDRYIVTDSFDSTIEDTLHKQKTQALVEQVTPFELKNDFIPPLQPRLFPAYVSAVKAKTFAYLKQTSSDIDEKDAAAGKFHQYGKEGVTDGKKRPKSQGRRRRGSPY